MPDRAQRRRRTPVLTFASGKGGVGKSNIVANLACLLSKGGRRILVLDGDLGLANIDVLFGISPRLTIGHFLEGTHSLDDVAIEGPHGLRLIPAASGVAALALLDPAQEARLAVSLHAIGESHELTLIDGPAGISGSVSSLARLADAVAIVTSPEPTAMVDAYALAKILHREDPGRRLALVVNNTRDAAEGERIHHQLDRITHRFLGKGISYWGHVVQDDAVVSAVQEQRPVVDLYPQSRASRSLEALALRIAAEARLGSAFTAAAISPALHAAPGLEIVH